MPKLHILVGVPGSGKSTLAKQRAGIADKVVSRDDIRFSLLDDEDEYFSKEKEVFNLFVDTIKARLDEGWNVWADATHLNSNSRWKLICGIGVEFLKEHNVEIIAHVFHTPIDVCMDRNETRKGTKRYVPKSVIRRMYHQLEEPSEDEVMIDYIKDEG